jgi:hypothetical protein
MRPRYPTDTDLSDAALSDAAAVEQEGGRAGKGRGVLDVPTGRSPAPKGRST